MFLKIFVRRQPTGLVVPRSTRGRCLRSVSMLIGSEVTTSFRPAGTRDGWTLSESVLLSESLTELPVSVESSAFPFHAFRVTGTF